MGEEYMMRGEERSGFQVEENISRPWKLNTVTAFWNDFHELEGTAVPLARATPGNRKVLRRA